ncbi:MAG: 4a-hydroxytetrahydrobiopterin dehydratase [Ktedonobacteraceae bacterium]
MPNDVFKLDDAEVQTRLQSLSSWTVSNGELQREFTLPSFPSAIFFVNTVAHIAELAAHHPDIRISYNKVLLHVATHSAGGITEKDFALARRIDALWQTFDLKPGA